VMTGVAAVRAVGTAGVTTARVAATVTPTAAGTSPARAAAPAGTVVRTGGGTTPAPVGVKATAGPTEGATRLPVVAGVTTDVTTAGVLVATAAGLAAGTPRGAVSDPTGTQGPSTTASAAVAAGWPPRRRGFPTPGSPRASRARSSTAPCTSSCAP
jgi:hypothetical protein